MKDVGTPLTEADRLHWIDASRGFAIFGIFMVNVPAFHAPYFLYGGGRVYWPTELDIFIQNVIDIFFQASFYTLFSFLFGFGIQMMKDRLSEKGLAFKQVIFRRLLILIGFGLIHAFLVWHGDILLSYGIIGLALLAFLNRKDGTILAWAAGILMFYEVLFSYALYQVRNSLGGNINQAAIEQAMDNYGNGTLLDIWSQNFRDWTYSNALFNWPFLIMSLLPLFLLGMYFARKRWLHKPTQNRSVLIKWWSAALLIFLVFKAGPYLFGNPEWFQILQDNVGGSACALFYVTSVTLASQSTPGQKLFQPFVSVGRMSLSNYILQSLFAFLLFYSVGFGLYGQVSPLGSVVIVVLFFSLQVLLSKKWLEAYRFGPLEWLWRSLTYGKKQALRRRERG
ncbi:DUF418 domain-containing protein [Thalassobacillus pellis]|uniref:DUF418 domain-containing protein n=1 Tax=Thalassobacillus pellis TaxID=748008 RepID=UPI001EF9A899|nr:DUF418 domain-containing protein [Thalassobacillus pellis]MBM7554089.1 uncharacterized protein [Thalassobacillus pellis]